MGIRKKPVWVLVVVAVLLLALGGVGGFLARGNNATPDPTGESWRLDYACPMAEHLEKTKGSVEDWEGPGLVDPDLDRVAVVGAAVGGMTGGASTGNEDLKPVGANLVRGISTLQHEKIVEGLDQVTSLCAKR